MEKNKEYIIYIYNTYSKLILRISYTYLRDSLCAEDILQEVILKIIQKNVTFSDIEKEKNWIIRVTINLCKDYLKSSWYRKKIELKDDITYIPKENLYILDTVLELPEKYKVVIYLYYYENYNIKEIAQILNKSQNTVGTWLSRAKKILRNKLGGWENE